MRITKVEVISTRVPIRQPILHWGQHDFEVELVRLHTDEGLVGLGQTEPGGHALLQKCVGRSPAEFLHDDSLGTALVAIYDLVAQAAGIPVSRLFSASPAQRIQPVWWSACLPPRLLQEEARRALEQGYRVHKTKARPYEDPARQMAALADVVPKDYVVWLDANSFFENPAKTLWVAETLKPFGFVKGFEEPIPCVDLDGYRTLRRSLPLRLGVHWGDARVDERTFVLERLCDAFVVEDYLWGQGMLFKVGVTNLSQQRLWVENGLSTGITQVCQAHQAAAFGFEYSISQTNILEDDLVVEPFTVENSYYRVPTKPGLGVTLDEAAVEKYRKV